MPNSRISRILVVEDDEGVGVLERRALERRGFQVTSAANVDEAVREVQAVPFDLIVSDYRLENATGLELLARIQALGFDIPVILVTGFSNESTVIEAIRCGARDFVPKSAEYLLYLPDAVERVLKAVQTERELAKSEARFQLFMDNSPAAAFIKDEEGRLLYVNRAAQQVLGRTDWRGRTDSELWPSATARQLRECDLEVLRTGHPVETQESVSLLSGEVRQFRTFRFPMEDVNGDQFVGGMAVDVTQQHAAEEALRQRDEQLRQSQKMEAIGTLAGGVAHEFNNLLQAVLGYARFAMASIEEAHPAQADLEIVVTAADRAALLTQQLLSFSRREPGQLLPLDANEAIRETVAMLRPLLGGHAEIELALDERLGLVSGDEAQLQQMLMNLCINARDAMPGGGKISISTVESTGAGRALPESGRYLALCVADTGCGMSADVKQKIFEPFFTTKPVGKGTGLGLAMVYGAVQHHGGTIEVDSEPGVGTRFTVYLPLISAVAADVETQAPPLDRRGSETILLAEDEPLVLDLTRRMLEGAGYRVLAARDGQEALALFRERREEIDLVILDAVMPRLGGWESLREIRSLGGDVPALFATGHDPQPESTPPEGPAPRTIQKPFAVDHLLDAVRSALEENSPCTT